MRSYDIRIKIPEGRIKEIMDKIDKAQETIYKCYDELVLLGAVTIEKASPNKDDASKDVPAMKTKRGEKSNGKNGDF